MRKAQSTTRVTVVLLNRHIAWLDRLTVDIRLDRGVILRRDALLRGIIEAAIRRKIDLTQADSAAAIVALLRK